MNIKKLFEIIRSSKGTLPKLLEEFKNNRGGFKKTVSSVVGKIFPWLKRTLRFLVVILVVIVVVIVVWFAVWALVSLLSGGKIPSSAPPPAASTAPPPAASISFIGALVIGILVTLATLCAAVGAIITAITAESRGWKKGLLRFALLESCIIAVPLLLWGIATHGATLLHIGIILAVIGVIAVIGGLVWYAVTRKKTEPDVTVAVAGDSSADSITPKGIFAMIAVIMFAVGWYTYIGAQADRNVWTYVHATLPWFIGFVVVGAVGFGFAKGFWPKMGCLFIVMLGMAIASTEVKSKVLKEVAVAQQEQQRIEQEKQEAYERKSAITPSSAKRWHLRLQQWDKQLNALPGFTDYEAQVTRLDDSAVLFSSMFICNKCHKWHTTVFSWKRESEWGTWTQLCDKDGTSSGRFKMQKIGVDKYQGQWVVDGYYTEYSLTLEGKIRPSFAL